MSIEISEDRARAAGVRLLRNVVGLLKWRTLSPQETRLGIVLFALTKTGVRRLDAISRLVAAGDYPEAAILARTLVELLISAAYVRLADPANEKERRAHRFWAFHVRQAREMMGRVDEYDPQFLISKGEEARDRIARLEGAFEEARLDYPDIEKTTSWAGLSYWKMVEAVGDPEERKNLKDIYRMVYFNFSDYAHPSLTGVQHAVEPENNPSSGLRFQVPYFAALLASHIFEHAAVEMNRAAPDVAPNLARFGRLFAVPVPVPSEEGNE